MVVIDNAFLSCWNPTVVSDWTTCAAQESVCLSRQERRPGSWFKDL